MRTLLALRNNSDILHLSDVFSKDGMLVEIANIHDPDDVIEHTNLSTPYDLLIHEPDLPQQILKKISARLHFKANNKKEDTACSLQTIFSTDKSHNILKKAYTAVCIAKGHPAHGIIKAGDFTCDLWNKKLSFRENYLDLTPKEYLLMQTLCLHKDIHLSSDMLIDYMYSVHEEPDYSKNCISRFLCNIKDKIKSFAPNEKPFLYRRNIGFKIADNRLSLDVRIKMGTCVLVKSENRLENCHGSINLRPMETNIMSILANKKIYSAEKLAFHTSSSENSLRVNISSLRKKMTSLFCPEKIETVQGGYKFYENRVPKPIFSEFIPNL